MTWAICQKLMDERFRTLPGLDLSDVAWPNMAFNPINGRLHYRIAMLPADSWAPYGDGTARRFKGVYQVSIYAPAGTGHGTLTRLVDAVCAHFDRLDLSDGSTFLSTEVPVPAPPLQDGVWFHAPISIPFYTR